MSFLDRLPFQRRPDGPLNSDGQLYSELWLDQRNAPRRIRKRMRKGEVTAKQAEQLQHFEEKGYLILSLDLGEEIYTEIDQAVESLWRDRPDDVAYAYHGLLTRFADADPEHRKPSCRIADLHTACDAALSLYLHPEIFEVIDLIFGEPTVATQSLYFEWGSQQGLHRDPVYVQMSPPSHLAAAWIALEDIGPDCGPLVYLPKSHRLPYYQFEPGRYLFDHARDGDEELKASQAWDERHCAEAGLELEALTCRRGDVLIWHHSLLHGGSFPTDPALTRKSFVIHFSTQASMPRVMNSYVRPGEEPPEIYVSERLIERRGARGFDSPLHVHASTAGGPTEPQQADTQVQASKPNEG